MMITAWISLIITICAVVFAIWLARKLLTNVKIWTPKRVSWFIMVYIAAGIVAMIVLAKMDQDIAILEEEELNRMDEAEQAFHETLNKAAYNQLDERYLKKSLVYELQGDTLTLDIPSNGRFYDIIIERNRDPEVRDVVVKYYETPHVHTGMDVSGYIRQPAMRIENDIFYMEPFSSIEIKYNRIIPTIQMVDYLFVNEYLERDIFGIRVLYFNVPAGVHITPTIEW